MEIIILLNREYENECYFVMPEVLSRASISFKRGFPPTDRWNDSTQ